MSLLAPGEPPAVTTVRENGESDLFLVCDHASNRIPAALGDLGLPDHERQRHIAWDIGAAGVARRLSEMLDATLVEQGYSRLVIDANRQPALPTAMPMVSEVTEIPGNARLTEFDRKIRVDEVFTPYHDEITRLLDARAAAGRRTVLVAVHSFTPVFKGQQRPWHIGIMYNRDPRIGQALLPLMRDQPGLTVGENEPYTVDDENDYTIPVHGERRGLPHVELELRQDLLSDEAGQADWADRLGRLLPRAAQLALGD
jgi:predicted N-formylglutamate amidohydrolase